MKRATGYQETREQNGCGSQQLGNHRKGSESPPLHLQLLVAGDSACRSNDALSAPEPRVHVSGACTV